MEKSIQSKLHNEAARILTWIIWLGINIYLFTSTYLVYQRSDRYHYLYLVLNESICISRACARALNFNCALIVLPMCKVINSWIRTKLLKYIHSNPRRLMNHMKGLHIMCAYAICILGVTHTLSHLVNALRFRLNFTDVIEGINVSSSKGEMTLWFLLGKIPGWSGILLLVILAAIVVTSFKAVRTQHYECFWYTHHLSLLFLVVVCFHGFGEITRYQINLDKHPRECHSVYSKTWLSNNTVCQEEPKFVSNEPESWKWIVGPLFLYFVDRLIRLFSGIKTCKISKVVIYGEKAIELIMTKKGFRGKPGQFIKIQCPDIAEFEWHAFTLSKCSSSEDDPTFSVLIKVAGDWTQRLMQRLSESCEVNDVPLQRVPSPSNNTGLQLHRISSYHIIEVDKEFEKQIKEQKLLPIVRVDGPYGSPNEDWYRFPVNVCVAAGIGMTPYAAALNYLKLLDPKNLDKKFKLKRMYLMWACRDINEFTWFLDLIVATSKHLESVGMEDFLVCKLFLTRSELSADDPSLAYEKMQWLKKHLQYGRPDLNEELKKIGLGFYKTRIGVFYCGPPLLSEVLYKACVGTKVRGNTFIFHKECL